MQVPTLINQQSCKDHHEDPFEVQDLIFILDQDHAEERFMLNEENL